MKTKIYILLLVLGLGSAFFINQNRLAKEELGLLESGKETFNLYLKATEEKDLEAVRALSYQLSDACLDEARKDECENLMLSANSFGVEIEQDILSVLGYDDKQLILANSYLESLEGDAPAIIRAVIYFIRDEEKNLKLLSFNPYDGAFIIKKDEATTTLSQRLKDMTYDTDGDGLSDNTETCADDTSSLLGCVKTDPKKKDTNGDGFWDSIERLFYKR